MRRWRRSRQREQARAIDASSALWLEARGRLFGRRRFRHVAGWHRYAGHHWPQTWLGWRDLVERIAEACGAAAWAALLEPEGAVLTNRDHGHDLPPSPPPVDLRLPVFTSAP